MKYFKYYMGHSIDYRYVISAQPQYVDISTAVYHMASQSDAISCNNHLEQPVHSPRSLC